MCSETKRVDVAEGMSEYYRERAKDWEAIAMHKGDRIAELKQEIARLQEDFQYMRDSRNWWREQCILYPK